MLIVHISYWALLGFAILCQLLYLINDDQEKIQQANNILLWAILVALIGKL